MQQDFKGISANLDNVMRTDSVKMVERVSPAFTGLRVSARRPSKVSFVKIMSVPIFAYMVAVRRPHKVLLILKLGIISAIVIVRQARLGLDARKMHVPNYSAFMVATALF